MPCFIFILPGTVTDPNITAIENVARIVPKEDCISQMLTCGNVVFDISYDRNEVEVAMDYLKCEFTYFLLIFFKPSNLKLGQI